MIIFNKWIERDIMDQDIVSLYLIRKKQIVSKYCEIFLKYTLNSKIDLNKIISKIVEIYFDNYYLEENNDFTILNKYFELGKTKESLMKNILLSSILFYKNSGLEAQIENDIKTIVILSNSIYLALNLDNYTNEYLNSALDIEIRLNNYFDKYQSKIKLDDKIDIFKDEIYNEVKKEISIEKKFFKSLVDDNYIISIRDNINIKNIFLVDYKYNIKLLNRYEKSELDKISNTKGIMDDILTIYIHKLTILVFKDLLCKNFDDKFFIEIDSNYFTKNKNLINLETILNNKSIKNRIVFVFNIKNLDDELSSIKYLHDNNYSLALNSLDENGIATSNYDMFNYVFIENDILEKYKDYKEIWNIKGIKFITDIDKFNYINEEYLLRENR